MVQPDTDKINFSAYDPYAAKYQQSIKKWESTGLQFCEDLKSFIEYSNDIDYIYKNIEEYHPGSERKILLIFEDIISDMLGNKKCNPIVTELFFKGRKLNNTLVLITQSYFPVPKYIRLNSTHYFNMKVPNRWELQKIAFNHSLDIGIKGFISLCKNVLQNHILFQWLRCYSCIR